MKSRRKSILAEGLQNARGMNEFGVFEELDEEECRSGREVEMQSVR